jgi:hypothetical protein
MSVRLVSQPFRGSWSQSPKRDAQVGVHNPPVHAAVPWAFVQVSAQLPQLVAESERPVSQPLLALLSQSPYPIAQVAKQICWALHSAVPCAFSHCGAHVAVDAASWPASPGPASAAEASFGAEASTGAVASAGVVASAATAASAGVVASVRAAASAGAPASIDAPASIGAPASAAPSRCSGCCPPSGRVCWAPCSAGSKRKPSRPQPASDQRTSNPPKQSLGAEEPRLGRRSIRSSIP